MKSASVISVFATIGLLAVGVACTKSVTRVVPTTTATDAGTDAGKVNTIPSGDDDDTTGDDDDSTSSSSSSGSSSSSSGSTVPKVSDCKKKATQNECGACCSEISPDGAQVYALETKKCICQADVCQTECKSTFCATPQKNPNTACGTCAQGAQETCGETVVTNCNADAKCKVFEACLEGAQCVTKPNE